MAGNVVDLGNGSYRLRVSIGSGVTRIPFSKNIQASCMKEAEKELALYVSDIMRNKIPNPSKMSFGQLTMLWKEKYADKRLAPATLNNYMGMLENRILPVFESMKIQKITPTHLNSFYVNLEEDGMRLDNRHDSHLKNIARYEHWIGIIQDRAKKYNRSLSEKESNQVKRAQNEIELLKTKAEKTKTLSAEAVNYHHRVMSSIFGKAVKWGYLNVNPAENADPPTPEETEKLFVSSDEQMTEIFQALSKEPLKYQALVLLDIFSGMRRGEIMGKDWVDINFDNGAMKIKKQRQYIAHQGSSNKKLKTKSSERIVSLPAFVLAALKMYKAEQTVMKLKLRNKWTETGKIFVQYNKNPGQPMHPETPSHWFPKFLKRNNLEHINFHGLRHTYASLIIDLGYDIPSAAEAMGHAQNSTFLNIYAHSFKNKHKIIADAINDRYARMVKEEILDTTLDTNLAKNG